MPDLPQKISINKNLIKILLAIWFGLAGYTLLTEISGLLTIYDHQTQFWQHMKFMTLKVWLPWLIMAPLVLMLSDLFPVTPKNWVKSLLIHSFFLVLLSISTTLLISLHYHYLEELSAYMATYQPWQHAGHFLFGDRIFLFNTVIYTAFIASLNIKNFSHIAQQKALEASQLNSQLMGSQLQALKMQINPHFLFNTLNVISVLVMKQDNDKAAQMVNHLSRFFRQTLDGSEQQWVSLKKEINQLHQYLAIEQVRFGERLGIVEDIDPEAMMVSVPSMLLQPLVENAIRHGLEEKEGPGQLTIKCRHHEQHISISIIDNGVGCDFSDPTSYKPGIGLSNVRARLQQLYARDDLFLIKSNPGSGVIVTVTLPIDNKTIGLAHDY
jgi:two-component system LytT family sensor kinase